MTNPRINIRAGSTQDLPAILQLRGELAMPRHLVAGQDTRGGGFLLGSSPDQYQRWLETGWVRVLEIDGQLEAFCNYFPYQAFRRSELWSRKSEVQWGEPAWEQRLNSAPVAYIDQLAARRRPQSRVWSTRLALAVLDDLFGTPPLPWTHPYVLTTTVIEPLCNKAAWKFLERAQAKQVAQLPEYYPEVGEIRSAIFVMDANTSYPALQTLRNRLRIQRKRPAESWAKNGMPIRASSIG